MSKEVDQRIVEMQFNNADFEQKVSKSINSLKQLKDASQMEDAGKGVEKLVANIKNVDFSAMANGIQQLNDRFSNLGIVGITIMQRLTNAAIDAGAKIGQAITAAPKDGWKEYELNLDSVKTILNSAKGADGLPVTLEKVNEKLAELNEYSDKTIYSFSDMTNNIGKFTNAGVDLDSAVTAIQGVANVAALSGANANDAARAMYNFGQALGSGSVKLIDWKSIENANMATIGFKEQLIQTAAELGVLRKEGDKYISTTTDMSGKVSQAFNATQGFNDSLSAQWMTSEVLTKTLAKYTDTTTDLGQSAFEAATKVTTFSKMIDTLKESMGSGWMQTFQIIFGDFEEASELWTGVYNRIDKVIQKVSGLRNAFFESWKNSGGRDALINSIKNIWDSVEYYVGLISKAFEIAFPIIDTTPIVSIEKGLEAITEKIKPVTDTAEKAKEVVNETSKAVQEVVDHTEEFNEIVRQIANGDWGNGQERIDRLKEAGYAFENLQNAVNETLGVEKRYETVMSDNEAIGYEAIDTIDQVSEATQKQTSAVKDLNEATKDLNPVTANLVKILLAVKSSTALIGKGFSSAWAAIAKGASVTDVIVRGLKFILDVLGAISVKIYEFTTWLNSFNSVSSFIKGLRKVIDKVSESFAEMGISLDEVGNFLDKLEHGFSVLVGWLKETAAAAKTTVDSLNFDSALNVLTQLAKFIGGAFLIGLNSVLKVTRNVYEGMRRLWDIIKDFGVVQGAIGAFKSFKEEVQATFEAFGKSDIYADMLIPFLKEMGNTLDRLNKLLGPVFVSAFEAFLSILEKMKDAGTDAFEAFKQGGVVDSAADVIEKFKGVLEDLPSTIKNFFDSVKEGTATPSLSSLPQSITDLMNSIGTFGSTLSSSSGTMLTDLIGRIGEFIKGLPSAATLGPFSGWVTQLGQSFDELKTTSQNASGTITTFVQDVLGKLAKVDFKNVAIIGLISSVALFVFRWSKVGKSAAKTINQLGKFILNGGKVATVAVDKYTGFLRIAAAIGIIAGAIWLLASVPAERFKVAVETIAAAFAAMFLTIELLTIQKIPDAKIKSIGIAFAGLGASFLLVAAAAKLFASMSDDELKKGGLALVGFVTVVVAATKIAEGVGPGAGTAFLGLSAALLMLIPSIKLLAGMDAHTLIKGGVAVFAFVNIIARAAKRAGEAKGGFGAFFGLSLALLFLIPSIKMLAGMDTKTLLKGGVAVFAFVNIMANAAKTANGGAKGFLGMGITIGILAIALKVLSTIDWKSLLTSSVSLKLVLDSIGRALSVLSKIEFKELMGSVLAMTLVLAAVGGTLYLLTTYIKDIDSAYTAARAIGNIMLAFAAMGPTIWILSKIPFKDGVVAAGNAMVFFGAMVLCLGALGEVASIGNGAAGAAIENGAGVLGRIIHNFLSALFPHVGGNEDTTVQAEKTVTLAERLSEFGDAIQGFLGALSETDATVIDKAKSLATAILTLTAADLLDAVAKCIRGRNDFGEFSNSIVPITEAIVEMNSKLEGIEFDETKIDTVIRVVSSMSDLAKALPKKGGWAQTLFGVQELTTFANDMQGFITGGFRAFVISVNHLGDFLNAGLLAKMLVLKNTTSSMVTLAKSLPASGFISQFIDGPKDLGAFATNMKDFITNGFRVFVIGITHMGDFLNVDLVDKIQSSVVPITGEMIALGAKLKEGGSILDFIIGRTDLGKFGSSLARFGEGISQYATSIATVKLEHINGMTDAMERLADLNASEKLEVSMLGTFSSCLEYLGAALAKFYTDSAAADPAQLSNVIGEISNLHNLLLIISGTDYSGIGNFAKALEELGKAGAQSFIDSFTNSATEASEAATAFINDFLTTIDTLKGEFRKKGRTVVLEFCVGINSNEGFLIGAGKSFVTKVGKGVDEKKTDNQNIGKRVVLEFCVGVNSNDGFLNGAGKHMVDEAIGGIRDNISDFYDQGEYSAEGYARGIRDNAREAAEEAAEMVREAARAAAAAQDSASPSKVYMGLGKDGIDGYILGFVKNTSRVVKAVTSVGKAGISAMQKTIDKTLSLVDGNLDYEPTITPVMDLSQLTSGVQQANLLLSDIHTDDLAASTAATIANAHNEAIAVRTAQPMNYSRDIAELIDNTSKIISAVKQNRYAIIDGDEAFRFFDRRLGMA